MIGIRLNDKNNQSYQGFQYPTSGEVEALDWDPRPVCGQGLHFFKDGEGSGKIVHKQAQDPESIWQIVEADDQLAVDLGGKWKAPRLKILKSGKRDEILKELRSMVGPTKRIMYTSEFAGDRGTVLVGDYGTAQAGDHGTARAGSHGFAQTGDHGTAEAGYRGTAQAGNYGSAWAGDHGFARAGYGGTAEAGYRGTARAGYGGTARAGNFGTAWAGDHGTAQAGDGGVLIFRRIDLSLISFNVDGVTVKANQKYKLGDGDKLVEVPG